LADREPAGRRLPAPGHIRLAAAAEDRSGRETGAKEESSQSVHCQVSGVT
jgi:hypothetical protein